VINFRFHIVSLIAVFLALTVGIVMGSTFVSRVTVDQLRSRLESVSHKDEVVRKADDDLRRQLATLQGFIDQAAPLLDGRRLDGANLALVAVRGVDGGVVRATVESLRTAGARVPAVFWLESAWALTDHGSPDKLAAALATPSFTTAPTGATTTTTRGNKSSSTTLPAAVDALRKQALREFGSRLVRQPRADADVLVSLQAAGFVAVDGEGQAPPDLTSYPMPNMRVVVVGGNDVRRVSQAVVVPLASALSDLGATVALTEAYQSAKNAARGDIVDDVRRNQALASRIPTIDDVDTAQGRTALILSLEEVTHGVVGHYGIGRGAKRQVPQPAAP